jgi:hypothetical protein
MRYQHLELIYSQSSLLYKVFPDAPQSILEKNRQRSGPHADGIVGSTQTKLIDQLSNQLQQLSIQQTAANQTTDLDSPPMKMSDVHSVQSTNPKATQQPDKKKKQQEKGKEDKKSTNNAGGGNIENNKLNYLCNLYMEDHPTHQCPWLTEAQKLLAQ